MNSCCRFKLLVLFDCNPSVCSRSSFSDFAQKYGKDDRFKNIDKMRERESLFNEYLLDVRKREKEEKLQRREQVSTQGIHTLSKIMVLRWYLSMISSSAWKVSNQLLFFESIISVICF